MDCIYGAVYLLSELWRMQKRTELTGNRLKFEKNCVVAF